MFKHHPRHTDLRNPLAAFGPARRAATRLGLSDVREHLPRRTASELAETLLPGRVLSSEISASLFEVYRDVFDPLTDFGTTKSDRTFS